MKDEWAILLADWPTECLSQEKKITTGFLKGNLDIRLMQLCPQVVRSKIITQDHDDLLRIVVSCLEHSPFNWFAPGKSTNINQVRLRLFNSLLAEARRTASNLNPLLRKIPAMAWLRKEILSVITSTPGLKSFSYWGNPSTASLSKWIAPTLSTKLIEKNSNTMIQVASAKKLNKIFQNLAKELTKVGLLGIKIEGEDRKKGYTVMDASVEESFHKFYFVSGFN